MRQTWVTVYIPSELWVQMNHVRVERQGRETEQGDWARHTS